MPTPPKRLALKLLRVQRDWTQAQLARRARMSVWRVNQIEVGRVDPTAEERARLTKTLGTTELGL